MTDIEQKALALVNEVGAELAVNYDTLPFSPVAEALYRAIEQHESFRREVSDKIEWFCNASPGEERLGARMALNDLIIPKPVDPLVEITKEAERRWRSSGHKSLAHFMQKVAAERGLEIREINRD